MSVSGVKALLSKSSQQQKHHFPLFAMPKELGENSGSAGVFGLLAERSSHYDGGFSHPLPSPPTPTWNAPSGNMKRCNSQPSISATETKTAVFHNTKDSQTVTVDDMRLAHGAVTSSTINNLFPSTGDYNSVAIRYDTAPQYRSNKILSSFHDEFQHFGERNRARGSSSAPTTPRDSRSDSSEGHLTPRSRESHTCSSSDSQTVSLARKTGISAAIASYSSRKLSRVSEEQSELGGGQIKGGRGKELVAHADGVVEKSQSGNLVGFAKPVDSIDGMSAQTGKPSISRQVFGWLHGPGNKVTVNRDEMNAFSPSSF